jgi:hypothetical protein
VVVLVEFGGNKENNAGSMLTVIPSPVTSVICPGQHVSELHATHSSACAPRLRPAAAPPHVRSNGPAHEAGSSGRRGRRLAGGDPEAREPRGELHRRPHYFSLTTNQPPASRNKSATSNQPAVLFSQNKSAPAISHQPTEQAGRQQRLHAACVTPMSTLTYHVITNNDSVTPD